MTAVRAKMPDITTHQYNRTYEAVIETLEGEERKVEEFMKANPGLNPLAVMKAQMNKRRRTGG